MQSLCPGNVPVVVVDVVVDVVVAGRAVDPLDGRRNFALASWHAVHLLDGLGVAPQAGCRAHPGVRGTEQCPLPRNVRYARSTHDEDCFVIPGGRLDAR